MRTVKHTTTPGQTSGNRPFFSPKEVPPFFSRAEVPEVQGRFFSPIPPPGPSGTLLQLDPNPEEGQSPGGGDQPQVEQGLTIDLLDPLNSNLTLFGQSLPSPRDIMNGVDTLRRFGRPDLPPLPRLPVQTPDLTEEQIREMGCRVLPSLCPTDLPAVPDVRLQMPRFRLPRLVFLRNEVFDHFIYDSNRMPERHLDRLDQTATDLHDHPNQIVDLIGHTDSRGSTAYNQRLSERRARGVAGYLQNRQVPQDQIGEVSGRGEEEPRFPNDATDSLAAGRNRRVEARVSAYQWDYSVPPSLELELSWTPNQPRAASISDTRARVLAQDRQVFDGLRTYLVDAHQRIRELMGQALAADRQWIRDNENVNELMSLLSDLIDDLNDEALVIRFSGQLPANVQARYSETTDTVTLRPINNAADRVRVAIGLVHEYAHTLQDRTREDLVRASGGPVAHTPAGERVQETTSRRQEVYFTRLLEVIGDFQLGTHMDFGEYLGVLRFFNDFEQERTGTPREQAEARERTRQSIETHYAQQIRTSTPTATFRAGLTEANEVELRTSSGTENLGVVPRSVTSPDALAGHLIPRVENLPNFQQLFLGSGGTVYDHITILVFHRNRKLSEFVVCRLGVNPNTNECNTNRP